MSEDIDLFTKELAHKYGVVSYDHHGMLAPPDFNSTGPYCSKQELAEAKGLALSKQAYLWASQDENQNQDPASFLDLRDGGSDTAGLPGKPIMTGWLKEAGRTLAKRAYLSGLKETANKIRRDFSALLIIGIGGSYTDIEGVISALNPQGLSFPIYFLGQHLSAEEYHKLFLSVANLPKPVAVNIISKSGTTTEPALASRIVLAKLKSLGKLGAVFATTDPVGGALRQIVNRRGYNPPAYLGPEVLKEFYIGEDIGGRFSCITPVGLFPYAVAGIAVEEFLAGYHYAMNFARDLAAEVAAARYATFNRGAEVAVFAYNLLALRGKILALRQLWPESTGKDGKGLNIMEEYYTSDAHSNGQLIKSGKRNMFEVFHFVDNSGLDFEIPFDEENADKLNSVCGRLSLHAINNLFMAALLLDHYRSGVPVTAVRFPSLNPFVIGMHTGVEHQATAIFGLMLGINPVNQPGVQGYKEIAFRLLGLKGDEAQQQALGALKDFGLS